jgi:hypothetical protein
VKETIMTTPAEPTTPAAPLLPAPPPLPPTAPVVPQGGFTQEQVWAAVEAARTEEKNKLYSRLEKTDEQVKTLLTEREERLAREKEEADRLAAEAKAAEDEKLTLKQRFEKSEAEHRAEFDRLNNELAQRDALLDKEREYAALTNYKVAKVAELREPHPESQHFGIADEFIDLIDGATQEEIDNSITTMVAKTRSIVEGMQQAQITARAAMPGVSPTAGNLGPIEQSGGTRTYTAEEIAAMAPNSKEFLALRAAHGMGRSSSNRGIFG